MTLATVLDPEVWTGPGLSPEIVARVVDDELASLRRGPTRLLGWYVSPNARTVDGQVSVSIEMPVATEVTQPLRDRIAASLGGAAVALEDVPAGIRDRLAAMSPTQWGMTLDGLVGRQIRAVSRVEIVMNGAPGGWRVVDVVHDGVSFRGEVPDRAAALAKAPHHRPSSVSAWVGALIATSFAIVVLAVVFRRRRRRG